MSKSKVTVILDAGTVRRLDRLVGRGAYPNRSRAVEEAVLGKLARWERSRLAEESAKLNPEEERALAEEGLKRDAAAWPES